MPNLIENEGQITAIQHGAGPMLVLAGPGSGKTYVITHRIAYLISEYKIPPNNILVITFTKAAAMEIQARANALHKQCAYVRFGTFHSVFYQILRVSRPNQNLTLISEREKAELIKVLLYENGAHDSDEEKDMAQQINSCLKAISSLKNRVIKTVCRKDQKPEENCREKACVPCGLEPERFRKVYHAYEEWLAENQKLDFDDMIRLCYTYLSENPRERKMWQEKFRYILIDEFQDINPLQYETIKLLSGNDNLFAVGDDDQSIYGFRGASPHIMKQFEQEYAAGLVQLSYNYRCSGNIMNIAARFIDHNQNRFVKTIVAVKETGEDVLRKKCKNRMEEMIFLEEELQSYAKTYPEKTQAILVRTNGLLSSYETFLGKDIQNDLWNDMFAYLSFINCGRKRADFLKIMNKPVRYISRNIVSEPIVDFELLQRRCSARPWIAERLKELERQIEFAKKLDLLGQLRYIWKVMGYEQYVKEGKDELKIKEQMLSFEKLILKAKECDNIVKLKGIMEEKREKEKIFGINVRIMTYHGSKGLEFDRVYLPDLNYGKVPHGRMLTEEELEEERRMFYVALTRAKESLVLMSVKDQTDSPFLAELD